ncbi:MAG: tetratricopeptide repeat protein [Acidobacteria bacterium]|nr:tetratricopeptide repeat protein [Acidobacteriota bacterium]
MKRKERHHLKENELAQSIIAARAALETRKKQLTVALTVILVVGAGIGGSVAWQRQIDARAQALLADAMVTFNAQVIPVSANADAPGEVPAAATLGAVGTYATESAKLMAALPKLKTAADAYPDRQAGITARYHYATSLAALGRHQEAIDAFDDVIARAGANGLYGRMSRLGKADTQMRAGQLDAAIAAWKELAASPDEELPKDAILMELARAYAAQGNQEEARKTFTQIVDEHPTSPYSAEARAELGS